MGTEEDFRELCHKAGEKGIRVVLDGVFNHTGSDSRYFNKYGRYPEVGAYQSKTSPYFSWFRFTNYPDEYESWWGIDTLPHVNEEDPGYINYILNDDDSVVKHWLYCGASGFRLDVVDELPDIFLERFRQVVKNFDSDAVIIGEVWEDAATKVSYGQKRRYLEGDQLDSVMNYPLQNGIIDFIKGHISGDRLSEIIEGLRENYPETVFYGLMNTLGTHDTPRIRTVFEQEADGELSQQRLFAAIIIWAMMPGIPCIYYGDEIGMKGEKDPFNRGCFMPDKADKGILFHYKKLINFRKRVSDRERLADLKYQPGECGENFFTFHRKGASCRLVTNVCREGSHSISINLMPGERIEDFFISGDVILTDFSTFRLTGCSGLSVLITR